VTRPPQEFPPAEPEKPTFLPRDLQVMLLFREKKNLALAPVRVNQAVAPGFRQYFVKTKNE
jgi:hypothetical protein